MKIKMTRTENGSVDGIRVTEYLRDVEYDLTGSPGERDLAAAFVNARMAVEVADGASPELPATSDEALAVLQTADVDSVESGGETETDAEAESDAEVDDKAIAAAPENAAFDAAPEHKSRKGKAK